MLVLAEHASFSEEFDTLGVFLAEDLGLAAL
jgi:hypothetical protein